MNAGMAWEYHLAIRLDSLSVSNSHSFFVQRRRVRVLPASFCISCLMAPTLPATDSEVLDRVFVPNVLLLRRTLHEVSWASSSCTFAGSPEVLLVCPEDGYGGGCVSFLRMPIDVEPFELTWFPIWLPNLMSGALGARGRPSGWPGAVGQVPCLVPLDLSDAFGHMANDSDSWMTNSSAV
mmetsp:Transcript_20864/g.62172  ORF Transcript_20864/g.62172 Transcript_20864/m.62172 type:complete len:180 (+) Transcript_20864:1331-1870(+)